jgi:hypothetical protein
MKKLTHAFSYIFSDNEWFNKVLIGGFYIVLIPIGIGAVMLNGFLSEFILRQNNGDRSMPYWRNVRSLFTAGIKKSSLFLAGLAVVYTGIFFSYQFTIPVSIIVLASLLTINAIFLTRSFNIVAVLISMGMLIAAISVGWMWIVVGWPLLIFLAMLVQIHLLTIRKSS